MSRPHLPSAVRQRIFVEARFRCGYCHAQQDVTGMQLHIEHIIPISAGGSSELENLWLACSECNNHKGSQTHREDPVSGELWRSSSQEFRIGARTSAGAMMVRDHWFDSSGSCYRAGVGSQPAEQGAGPTPLGDGRVAPTKGLEP